MPSRSELLWPPFFLPMEVYRLAHGLALAQSRRQCSCTLSGMSSGHQASSFRLEEVQTRRPARKVSLLHCRAKAAKEIHEHGEA